MDSISLVSTDKIEDDFMSTRYIYIRTRDGVASDEWFYSEKGCKRGVTFIIPCTVVSISTK